MISETFSQGQSLLHRMDARIKILATGICLMAVSAIHGHAAALAALLFAVVLILLAKLKIRSVLLRLAPVNVFFLVLGLVLGFTYPGQPLESLPRLSHDGLSLALRIFLKGNALLLIFMALACTSSVPALAQALQSLRLPRKMTLLLAFTFRQIFLVFEEFQRLHRAVLARGFHPRCSLHTYRTYAVLLGQTLLRSLARAERIHGAMLLRGFSGQFRLLSAPPWNRADAYPALGLCIPPLLISLHDRWPW
ncbi:cobalt ECF transporter T component CbiQ [Desulfonatronum parangueonense]